MLDRKNTYPQHPTWRYLAPPKWDEMISHYRYVFPETVVPAWHHVEDLRRVQMWYASSCGALLAEWNYDMNGTFCSDPVSRFATDCGCFFF
jgi:hypothetical protein